ncbi:MAG TPA: tetratricopeptide repeat protein [Kofleriaceae bacterium]
MSDDATEHDVPATDVTKREGHASERTPTGQRNPPPMYLDRGDPIGRYVVLDRLGEGGMGVVYSAFDPELDRKVAIKLLQGKTGGSTSMGDQAWLLREAQALARLAHPNVVNVHDVGTLPGDRVFVAMELVDGLTLRKWVKSEARSWRDVLPVMIAAGQGLAAAHAAGLVHRDVKPDNVLVGNDGRVRVMDFGLAKVSHDPDSGPVPRTSASELSIDARSPLAESLTVAGTVVGTPAYMAPELYDGNAADAASDQFSFGVMLFEALYRTRPFTKEQLMPPRAEVPKPKQVDAGNVPAKLQRIVLRALSIDPAQRFPSMATLLAELGVDPNAGRRRILIGTGVLALAGAGVAAVLLLTPPSLEPCQGIDQRLAGVWDAGVKKKISAAFSATKKPYATQAFAALERSFDGYAKEWVATSTESCRATRVRRDQTEDVLSLRQSCLDQRLDELRAVTQLLAESDGGIVDKAEKIGGQLEPLASCSNVAVLRAPGVPTAAQRPKLAVINKHIADAKANMIIGRYLPTLVGAQKALDLAKQVGLESAVAEAELVRGAGMISTGNAAEAVSAYQNASWAALRGKRDDLAAAAAYMSAMITSDVLGNPTEAQIFVDLGDAAAARAGLSSVLEQKRHTVAGLVAAKRGDNEAAVAAHEKALAAAQRIAGPDDAAVWGDEVMLATTLLKAQLYTRAVKHFEHAMSVREKIVGSDHADIAVMLTMAGVAYSHLGERGKAKAAYDRALAIREKAYGKRNPLLITTLNNYADLLRMQEDWPAAQAMIDRAMDIAKIAPGPDHPLSHTVATSHAEIVGGSGKIVEARKLFDELLARERRLSSETLPITLAARAELELRQRAWADAAMFAEQAIAAFERAGGMENSELVAPLVTLAKARIGAGDRAVAKPLVERALAIGTKAGKTPTELKPARDVLATLPP